MIAELHDSSKENTSSTFPAETAGGDLKTRALNQEDSILLRNMAAASVSKSTATTMSRDSVIQDGKRFLGETNVLFYDVMDEKALSNDLSHARRFPAKASDVQNAADSRSVQSVSRQTKSDDEHQDVLCFLACFCKKGRCYMSTNPVLFQGPRGPRGPPGKDGKDVRDGRDGCDGCCGRDGFKAQETMVYPPPVYQEGAPTSTSNRSSVQHSLGSSESTTITSAVAQ